MDWIGTTGVAVCVYTDDVAGTIDWYRWTTGGGWALQTDVSIAGKGLTESVLMEAFPAQDELMVVFSDSNSDLFVATYDGTSWSVTNGGAALETYVSKRDTVPFGVRLKRPSN